MTTMTMDYTGQGRLEELVDRLLSAVLGDGTEPDTDSAPTPSLARSVHEAQRFRQADDLDGALAMLAEVDTTQATDGQLRWLYAEWLDIARRRFAEDNAALFSPATGRAAALVERDGDGTTLAVASVLGMRWPVGKTVSRRSLRGLKHLEKGGAAWS